MSEFDSESSCSIYTSSEEDSEIERRRKKRTPNCTNENEKRLYRQLAEQRKKK